MPIQTKYDGSNRVNAFHQYEQMSVSQMPILHICTFQWEINSVPSVADLSGMTGRQHVANFTIQACLHRIKFKWNKNKICSVFAWEFPMTETWLLSEGLPIPTLNFHHSLFHSNPGLYISVFISHLAWRQSCQMWNDHGNVQYIKFTQYNYCSSPDVFTETMVRETGPIVRVWCTLVW